MGRNAEPIDLIQAKGRKHLGQREILERKAAEIPVAVGDLSAPSYLTKTQKAKFEHYSELLGQVGMKELDVDCLARYIIAHDQYLAYIKLAAKVEDVNEKAKLVNLADKFFNQAHKSASALGLTITSRCKLVLPKALEEDDEL